MAVALIGEDRFFDIGYLYRVNGANALALLLGTGGLNVLGNVDIGGTLDVAGITSLLSALNVSGDLIMPNGSGGWRVELTNGDGRVNLLWNATGGASPVFVVAEESAMRIRMHLGEFSFEWADGAGKLAGNPIVWGQLLHFDDSGLRFKDGTVVVEYPGVEIPTARTITLPFGGDFKFYGRFAIVNGTADAKTELSSPVTRRRLIAGTIKQVTHESEIWDLTTEWTIYLDGVVAETFNPAPGGVTDVAVIVTQGQILELENTSGTHAGESTIDILQEVIE